MFCSQHRIILVRIVLALFTVRHAANVGIQTAPMSSRCCWMKTWHAARCSSSFLRCGAMASSDVIRGSRRRRLAWSAHCTAASIPLGPAPWQGDDGDTLRCKALVAQSIVCAWPDAALRFATAFIFLFSLLLMRMSSGSGSTLSILGCKRLGANT